MLHMWQTKSHSKELPRVEERPKEKAIVEEEDDVEQPRIGALQLETTVKVQEVDPKEDPTSLLFLNLLVNEKKARTTSSPRRRPISWVLRWRWIHHAPSSHLCLTFQLRVVVENRRKMKKVDLQVGLWKGAIDLPVVWRSIWRPTCWWSWTKHLHVWCCSSKECWLE